MPNFLQATPFFQVTDLDGAVKFFTGKLGFRSWSDGDFYAYVDREGAAIRLMRHHTAATGMFAYFDIEDADGLWTEFRQRLTDELRNNPEGPRDQTYDKREFTVFGPEGIVLFFGQTISHPAPDSQPGAA